MDCFGTYLYTCVQTCGNVRVRSATQWTASVHTLHMSKPVLTFVFKVLRNGLLRYIPLHMSKPVDTFVFKVLRSGLRRYKFYACPNLWTRSCSKCYAMDCFGTYLYTCPNLWQRSCSKFYAMDCFGTYFTHVQTCDNVHVQSATQWTASVHTLTHVQTCGNVRVQSATQWTASVHTLHMSKPVITFVFKVLRNGLLRYILYTCPNLWTCSCSKCYAMDCLVHTLHMSKPVLPNRSV